MRIASLFFSLLLSLTAFGQPSPINRRAFAIAGLASQSAFSPTNVCGCELFLSYLDLPLSNRPAFWTDQVHGIVFTNKGASLPTNSPNGMYFPGVTGSYFENATTGIRMSNNTDSVWLYMTIIKNSDTFDAVLSTSNTVGAGLLLENLSHNIFNQVPSQAMAINLSLNVPYSININVTNTIGVTGYGMTYTNGVLDYHWNLGIHDAAGAYIWGIGQDANSDKNTEMYIKFIGIYTNCFLSPTDVSNLTYYGSHN